MKHGVFRVLVLITIFLCASVSHAENFGKFIGKVVTEWLDDGRRMKLVQPFAYVDPAGLIWDAPADWVIDGASIPRIAWSIIGGPFEGNYRQASVIHDVGCDKKQRPWRDVHRAFYTAMLASGVDAIKAKIMYGAVYHLGPRWGEKTHIAMIPLEDVEKIIGMIVHPPGMHTLYDEPVDVEVTPVPRRGCPQDLACDVPIDLPPTEANVSVISKPLPLTLNSEDFEKLKVSIEQNDLPLDAIERFHP